MGTSRVVYWGACGAVLVYVSAFLITHTVLLCILRYAHDTNQAFETYMRLRGIVNTDNL